MWQQKFGSTEVLNLVSTDVTKLGNFYEEHKIGDIKGMNSKGFSVAFSNIHFYFVNEFAADIYDQAVDTFMALLIRKVEVCLLPVRGEEEANAYMQLRADNIARNNAFLKSIGYGNG